MCSVLMFSCYSAIILKFNLTAYYFTNCEFTLKVSTRVFWQIYNMIIIKKFSLYFKLRTIQMKTDANKLIEFSTALSRLVFSLLWCSSGKWWVSVLLWPRPARDVVTRRSTCCEGAHILLGGHKL